MSLFKKAEVSTAFLKMALMGFAGAGKTYTATEVAVGLVLLMRERKIPQGRKPLFFIDTETGSDWVLPRVEKAGIEMFTAKTRAFSDLLEAVREAEANSSLLLVDSITHFWVEITESYKRKRNRTRLQFEDWDYLKTSWRQFTDLFINSSLHIVMCGRAGFEYDYFKDEETGKKQLEKTNIKMKAESEMGYEPSLLVLMERELDMESKQTTRTATILKDRSTLLDGKEFINPTFKDFLPHIERLNLGGWQLGVDTSRTSDAAIKPDKRDWNPVQRRIVLGEIEALMTEHVPGRSDADRVRKTKLIRTHFNGAAWPEIEEVMPLFDLRAGYDSLYRALEAKPSRYSTDPAPAPTAPTIQEPIDELPDDPTVIGTEAPQATAPKNGKANGRKSYKDTLLADILRLGTLKECSHWATEVSSSEKFNKLNASDQNHVYLALSNRQAQITEALT